MGQTRGRRREKKNKKELDPSAEFIPLEDEDAADKPEAVESEAQPTRNQAAFFGLLDREELEYFKTAESTLGANALLPDERGPFVDNVFIEARGKELKLVTNQVCSKLVERLIAVASHEQLLSLLEAFKPHFYPLCIQKFASHCVQSLLCRLPDVVNHEMLHKTSTCAEMIGEIAKELAPNALLMAKEKYASHCLRTLLLLVGGLPVAAVRSKKSKLARHHTDIAASNDETLVRELPEAFKKARSELLRGVTGPLDAVEARRLAIDAVASPVLQVVIRIQASRSNFDLVQEIMGSESFVYHCLEDSVGCHFMEACMLSLPQRPATSFYQKHLKGHLVEFSKRDPANYLVQAALTSQLPQEVKLEALSELEPHLHEILPTLGVVRAMLKCCPVDSAQHRTVAKLVASELGKDLVSQATDLPRALLVEELLQDSAVAERAGTDFAESATEEMVKEMACDPTRSHALQALYRPDLPIVVRRKLLNAIVPCVATVAPNVYGSHIVDKLWTACDRLKFLRERIADTLAKNSETVKASVYGRRVWRNWQIDRYLHARKDWESVMPTAQPAALPSAKRQKR